MRRWWWAVILVPFIYFALPTAKPQIKPFSRDVPFSLDLSSDGTQYHLSGWALLSVMPLDTSTLVEVELKRVEIRRGKTLILGYERTEDRARYWADRLNPALMRAFKIDLNEHELSQDHSLLREPFSILLDAEHQIAGISIAKGWERAIRASTEGTVLGRLIDQELRDPKTLALPKHYQRRENGFWGRQESGSSSWNPMGIRLSILSEVEIAKGVEELRATVMLVLERPDQMGASAQSYVCELALGEKNDL